MKVPEHARTFPALPQWSRCPHRVRIVRNDNLGRAFLDCAAPDAAESPRAQELDWQAGMSFFINLDMPMGLESLDRVPTLEVTPPIAAVGREYDHAMAVSRHLLSHIGHVLTDTRRIGHERLADDEDGFALVDPAHGSLSFHQMPVSALWQLNSATRMKPVKSESQFFCDDIWS